MSTNGMSYNLVVDKVPYLVKVTPLISMAKQGFTSVSMEEKIMYSPGIRKFMKSELLMMKHQYCRLDWKKRSAANYRPWLGRKDSK